MVEGRNTGVPLIIKAMKQNGSGSPEFKTDSSRSYFLVVLPIHPVFVREIRIENDYPVQKERVRHRRRNKDELRQMIIPALGQKELPMRELSSQLGYSKPTDTVRAVVDELIKDGMAELRYPSKAQNPRQKIRLVKGRR